MKEVIIYTVNYCPYCKKAEMLLKENNISFKNIDITENENEHREKLAQYYDISGRVTVPQIIIGGRRIGGFDELSKLNSSGELDNILKD